MTRIMSTMMITMMTMMMVMAQKVSQLRHFEMGPENGDPAYLFFFPFPFLILFHMISFVISPVTLWSHRPQWVPIGRAISFYAQFINTRYEGGKSGEVGQKLTDKKCRIQPKVK